MKYLLCMQDIPDSKSCNLHHNDKDHRKLNKEKLLPQYTRADTSLQKMADSKSIFLGCQPCWLGLVSKNTWLFTLIFHHAIFLINVTSLKKEKRTCFYLAHWAKPNSYRNIGICHIEGQLICLATVHCALIASSSPGSQMPVPDTFSFYLVK